MQLISSRGMARYYCACVCLVLTIFPSSADDTEIFFNTPNAQIKPNILFLLDNSQSMEWDVETQSVYDNSKVYSGSYNADDIVTFDDDGWDYVIPASKNKCKDLADKFGTVGSIGSYQLAGANKNVEAVTEEREITLPRGRGGFGSRGRLFSRSRTRTITVTVSETITYFWEAVQLNSLSNYDYFECPADSGVHGVNADSSDLYTSSGGGQAWAADASTEISWSNIPAREYWSGNYANWYDNHRGTEWRRKIDVMKEVINNIVNGLTGVNIGLMAFNNTNDYKYAYEGSRILVPVKDVDGVGHRTLFLDEVSKLGYDTLTPLSESLFEGMKYFAGDKPFLAKTLVEGTAKDGKYISPITDACQANHIVLMTDGEPTYDENHNSTMAKTVGTCRTSYPHRKDPPHSCLDEIADHLHGSDADVNSDISGNQSVTVHTVGFATDQQLLLDTANKGGGSYYTANDTVELENAFNQILRAVLSTSSTFVSPGIAVNSFNRLNHRDALFFALFSPQLEPSWHGNLKRYRLDVSGNIMDNSTPPQIATDTSTGFFKREAKSWWSSVVDGAAVDLGGVRDEFSDNNTLRKVYTYYEGSSSKVLSNPVNAVTVANKANLTKAMFGNTNLTSAEHEAIINWTRGADPDDEDNDNSVSDSRAYIADPLHSVPHLVTYGGTDASPDISVFFGDNQGFLHAINGETGEEQFAFIPEATLDKQLILKDNNPSTVNLMGRPYGLDGSIASWINDINGNGTISGVDGDHVYIYTGMRRGGSNYYGLNVTDRNAPEILWVIKGGTGLFSELGQTWSKPVVTSIKIDNAIKDVLIFSGGYDGTQDSADVRTADTSGRAMYIVDATTGALLWWAGPSGSGAHLELTELAYSIPATPRVIDVSGNGLADQIYVGDMGGQVWRFDINNGNDAASLVDGGVIADFAGATTASNRRFYHTPDLFGLRLGYKRYLGLVIGSGWQAHPLDKDIDDRIYMLRIPEIGSMPDIDGDGSPDYIKVTENDLFDTTDNLIGEGTDAQKALAAKSLAAARGWYIRLTNSGEKVLSRSQTINNQIFITTYEPKPSTMGCVPTAGVPRLYHMNVVDGTPNQNYDNTGSIDDLKRSDRHIQLHTTGLPPNPQRMRVEGQDIICAGAECMQVNTVTGVIETYWYEE